MGCPKTQKLSQKTMFPARSFLSVRDVQLVSQMSGTARRGSGRGSRVSCFPRHGLLGRRARGRLQDATAGALRALWAMIPVKDQRRSMWHGTPMRSSWNTAETKNVVKRARVRPDLQGRTQGA